MEGRLINGIKKRCLERSYSIGAVVIKICFAFVGF